MVKLAGKTVAATADCQVSPEISLTMAYEELTAKGSSAGQ